MQLRQAGRLLVLGLFLGLTFDVLFNGKMPGISVPLFALLLMIGLALTLRWESANALRSNLWLPVALLIFATMVMVRANGFLTFLNVCVCLGLLSLIAVYLTQKPTTQLLLPEIVLAPLHALGLALFNGIHIVAQARRSDLANPPRESRGRVLPVVRGLLLAFPVLVVFVSLLASADLVFGEWVQRLLDLDLLATVWSWARHGVLILLIGIPVAGALAYTARTRKPDSAVSPSWLTPPRFIGATESLVVLNSVNALFAVFVGLQLTYLFGGLSNISAAGYTYAEYARRGFAELVMVAVLTLVLVYVLRDVARLDDPKSAMAFQISATLLVGLTCVMLVSAFRRLLMYETAYGFTELRIYVHTFMVWLGLLLAWFGLTLWRRSTSFGIGLIVAVLGFVLTLNVLNPDALIVQQNARRYQGLLPRVSSEYVEERIDVNYLTGLSDDAVPALIELANTSTGEVRDVLEKDLRARLSARKQDQDWRTWQAYHLSRSTAFKLLSVYLGE